MALLLQGRGYKVYNLRRGVHFRDGGTSACCHEGGTVAVPLACARVPRGVRPDQADRGGASLRAPGPAAERGPDEAQRALVRSRACAPRRRARRGEPACALASAVARDEDWTRKKFKLRALRQRNRVSVRLAFASGSARRYFRAWDGIPSSCQSRSKKGYRSPVYMPETCPMGGGTINRGGTLNRT